MRFITDESKGILGKPDSQEMWEQFIDQIPNEVFLKKDVKILCPACGHGTEADIAVKRMQSLGRTQDEIKESIYLIDKYKVFTKDAVRRGYKHVFKNDFLKWTTDLKFDVVLGNPPYREGEQHAKKIWPDFTIKSIELLKPGGYISWIIPTGWLDSDNAQQKKVRTRLTTDYNLLSIDRTTDQFFKVGVEILSFLAKKEPYQKNTTYKSFVEEYTFDLTKGLQKTKEEILIEGILDKVLDEKFDRLELIHEPQSNDVVKEKDDTNQHWVIYSTANRGYSATKLENDGKLKIGLNVSSSFYSNTTKDNNMPITTEAIGGLMYYKPLKTVEEGEQIKSFLSTKLIRFFASVYKRRNSGFCHAVRQNQLPKVENKYWNDQEVFNLFQITQEEQEFINQRIG